LTRQQSHLPLFAQCGLEASKAALAHGFCQQAWAPTPTAVSSSVPPSIAAFVPSKLWELEAKCGATFCCVTPVRAISAIDKQRYHLLVDLCSAQRIWDDSYLFPRSIRLLSFYAVRSSWDYWYYTRLWLSANRSFSGPILQVATTYEIKTLRPPRAAGLIFSARWQYIGKRMLHGYKMFGLESCPSCAARPTMPRMLNDPDASTSAPSHRSISC
jgi:hypothetical protein